MMQNACIIIQKRDALAILKVPVVHGNNSVLHLLKLEDYRATKINPVWEGMERWPCSAGAGADPVLQGNPALLLTLSWYSWCVQGWVSQHQSVKFRFCVEKRSSAIYQYNCQHRRYKTEVKREV